MLFNTLCLCIWIEILNLIQQQRDTLVGSLASEFLGWSWKTHVGIPMLDIGIPTSEFQRPT